MFKRIVSSAQAGSPSSVNPLKMNSAQACRRSSVNPYTCYNIVDHDQARQQFREIIASGSFDYCLRGLAVDLVREYVNKRKNGGEEDIPNIPFPDRGMLAQQELAHKVEILGRFDEDFMFQLRSDSGTIGGFHFYYRQVSQAVDYVGKSCLQCPYVTEFIGDEEIEAWMQRWDINFLKRQLKSSLISLDDIPENMREKVAQEVEEDVRKANCENPKSDLYFKLWEKERAPKKVAIPKNYLCPISLEMMSDPVMAEDGDSYEREKIERFFKMRLNGEGQSSDPMKGSSSEQGPVTLYSPMTQEVLESTNVISNKNLRSTIRQFLDENPSCLDRVYLSERLVEELFVIINQTEVDAENFKAKLQQDMRLLYRHIGVNRSNLLSIICDLEDKNKIRAYLPILFSLLRASDWRSLVSDRSVIDWLIILSKICDQVDILPQLREHLKSLESMLELNFIPLKWAELAIDKGEVALLRLFAPLVGDVNVPLDWEEPPRVNRENLNVLYPGLQPWSYKGNGDTLLHLSAVRGAFQMIEILVKQGGDLNRRNSMKLKPIDIARQEYDVGGQKQYVLTIDQIKALKILPALELLDLHDAASKIAHLESVNKELVEKNKSLEERLARLERLQGER